MLRKGDEGTPNIRKLEYEMSSVMSVVNSQGELIAAQANSIRSLLVNQAQTNAAPVANLLWNGELGHSVHTWHDATAAISPPDENEEAVWWFSHNAPASAKTFLDANVTPASDQIAITSHGFTVGLTVDLITTGILPAGLATATTYFVIVVNANTIKLASTVANAFSGTAVNITAAAGGGTHTVQPLLLSTNSSTTTPASVTNNTLKTTAHTTYNSRYARWDATNGWAELTDTMSVDALLPANFVDATTPLARIGLIAARKNIYIELTEDCRLAAGIWDNTSAQRKFLASSVGFTAELSGAAGAVNRQYKIFITSDRGYTILSPVVTIATGPSDAQFSSSRNVVMAWPQQAGQLQVEIYEYLPAGGDGVSAAQYRLLTQISAATSYIHLGSYLSVVSGYPTPTGTELNATYFTRTGEVENLAINGVATAWDTVIFPAAVPSSYNKGNTTDRQWARVWLTVAPNLFIEGCTTNGTSEITAPTAAAGIPTAFAAEYASLFASGLTVEVYDSADTLILTTITIARVSDTILELDASVASGSNRKIRIVGGGFHGVIIDKIHLGYQQNTSYAPNSLDIRTLQPRAAPSSSSQGGVGGGGSGGGIFCVAGRTPIKMSAGNWKAIQTTRPGQLWAAAGLKPNTLVNLRPGFENVRRVRSANGCEIECTDTEKFVVDNEDVKGTALFRLRVGDSVLTEVDDRIESSRIVEISDYLGKIEVFTPSLSDNNLFIAGEWKPSLWRRIVARLARTRKVYGGFVLHNEKPPDEPPVFI